LGVVSPFGFGAAKFWNGLLNGEQASVWHDAWSMPTIGSQLVARVPAFSPREHLPRLRPPLPPRFSQLATLSGALAIKDAELEPAACDPSRIGTILATEFGPSESVESYLATLLTQGADFCSPLVFTRTVANSALGDLARYFQCRGVSSLLFGENP